jgi:hypothetical protein
MTEPTTPAAIEAAPDGFMASIDAAFEGMSMPESDEVLAASLPIDDIPDGDDAPEVVVGDDTEDDGPFSDVDVKDWTPEAARRFKEMKSELSQERREAKELRDTIAQREARLAELEALSTNPEVDTLRQKVEEYESSLLITKLEDTQAYQVMVAQPLREVVDASDAIANKYGVDPDVLFDALSMTDEELQSETISELLNSATERDRFKAYQLIEKLKPIQTQRDALQQNSEEALREAQELESYTKQAESRSRAESRRVATKQVVDRVASKLEFLSKMEGIDMKQVADEVAAVDPSSLSPVANAYNQVAASLFPKIAREYLKMVKENDALVTKLAGYAKAAPRVGGTSRDAPAIGDNVSFVDAIARQFGG